MIPHFKHGDLDGEVVFDRSLVARDLEIVQVALASVAPKWASRLRLWRAPDAEWHIDVGSTGALESAVREAIAERGGTYQALVKEYGGPPDERAFGSAEFRGAGPELVVVVAVDEVVLGTRGLRRHFGNRISLQVRRPRIEGRESHAWMRDAFERLCADLSPAWGSAGDPAEYWAKVMSDPPMVDAVGRDFGRYLPGVFWQNFFGSRILDLVGEDRLLSAAAERVIRVDGGVLVELATDPATWETSEYARTEARVREHLGTELFFSKALADRATVVPDWSA